jgi:hypothetical protein
MISTLMPVCSVNASKIPSVGVNDSCASSVSVTESPLVEEADVDVSVVEAAQLASISVAAIMEMRFMSALQGVRLNDE